MILISPQFQVFCSAAFDTPSLLVSLKPFSSSSPLHSRPRLVVNQHTLCDPDSLHPASQCILAVSRKRRQHTESVFQSLFYGRRTAAAEPTRFAGRALLEPNRPSHSESLASQFTILPPATEPSENCSRSLFTILLDQLISLLVCDSLYTER